MLKRKQVIIGIAAVLASSPAFSLVITPTDDGNVLANSILGSGVSIVGVSYNGGGTTASGTFTGGLSSGLGFDEGIILTSGDALDAVGPNVQDGTSTSLGTGSNAALAGLIPGFSVNDSIVLSIDFTTDTGDLFFNFAFASEEYNEYVNSNYNDVFGFFVNGTDPSDNIAEAPDGQPFSINNVNCGNPFTGTGPNCGIFNNNDLNDGGPFFDIEYDGFTDSVTASITGLAVGVTHSILIGIADAGDTILDSAVFIQGGTFGGAPPTEPPPSTSVPEPGTLLLLGAGVLGLGFARRKLLAG